MFKVVKKKKHKVTILRPILSKINIRKINIHRWFVISSMSSSEQIIERSNWCLGEWEIRSQRAPISVKKSEEKSHVRYYLTNAPLKHIYLLASMFNCSTVRTIKDHMMELRWIERSLKLYKFISKDQFAWHCQSLTDTMSDLKWLEE